MIWNSGMKSISRTCIYCNDNILEQWAATIQEHDLVKKK